MATKPAPAIQPRNVQWYGLRADAPDRRDLDYTPSVAELMNLPPAVDLRQHCPPVMDQGPLGSCTAHGITAALRYALMKSGQADYPMARLQLYIDERGVEGTIPVDSGAEIRTGIKCAARIGVAHESLWPYDVTQFKRRPPKAVYADALKFEALEYKRVQISAAHVKAALSAGFPVVIGLNVYAAFEGDDVARNGVVPMPAPNDAPAGGHCVIVVGYGQHSGYFTVQNSWGKDWGDSGMCYFPEQYIGDPSLGSDYWIVPTVKVQR